MSEEQTFEKSISRLEEIVDKMERGDLTLDESLSEPRENDQGT